MYPGGEEMYNQLGDDRDHAFLDLLSNDSSDYGWGRGKERPVYPCTGRPQGIVRHRNRANGFASTAGKYASTFALAAASTERADSARARTLRERAIAAYEPGGPSRGGSPESEAVRIASDSGKRPRNGTCIRFAPSSAPPVPNGSLASPQCGQ